VRETHRTGDRVQVGMGRNTQPATERIILDTPHATKAGSHVPPGTRGTNAKLSRNDTEKHAETCIPGTLRAANERYRVSPWRQEAQMMGLVGDDEMHVGT
jgi:hypothetical protein